MRIYDIHNQNPDWVENPTAHRAEIREAAHAYIWDFFKMGADVRDRVLLRDLNAIADNRGQILAIGANIGDPDISEKEQSDNKTKAQILEKVFRYIIRYLAYYGYALQYDDVEHFYLVRDNDLYFIDREEWLTTDKVQANEDFTEIADILRNIERDEAQQINYIDLGDDKAKALYKELNEKKTIVDCNEDDFLWYFGSDGNRTEKKQPERIKWNDDAKKLAYLTLLIETYKNETLVGTIKRIFHNYKGTKRKEEWGELSNDKSKMNSGKAEKPKNFEIKAFYE